MLTAGGGDTVQDLTLGYDAASNIVSIADHLDAARSQTFAYVAGNPLTRVDPDGRYALWLVPFAPEAAGIVLADIVAGAALIAIAGDEVGTGLVKAAMAAKEGESSREESARRRPAIPDCTPSNLCEQLALAEAKAGAGTIIMYNLADAERLVAHYGAGLWVKRQHTHVCPDGRRLVIHYFSNGRGLNVELKFV